MELKYPFLDPIQLQFRGCLLVTTYYIIIIIVVAGLARAGKVQDRPPFYENEILNFLALASSSSLPGLLLLVERQAGRQADRTESRRQESAIPTPYLFGGGDGKKWILPRIP